MKSIGKTLIKAMSDQDFEVQRQRRMSGADKAAADKREQVEKHNQRKQGLKLAGLSAGTIDEAEKWANLDPNTTYPTISTFPGNLILADFIDSSWWNLVQGEDTSPEVNWS